MAFQLKNLANSTFCITIEGRCFVIPQNIILVFISSQKDLKLVCSFKEEQKNCLLLKSILHVYVQFDVGLCRTMIDLSTKMWSL